MLESQLWYAAQTRSNFEKRVAAELEAKGFVSYLPAYEEVHRWKDRYKSVSLPLFPGYVFVRLLDDTRFRLQVLKTVGVVRILGHNGGIESIPEAEIESIRALLRARVPFLPHPFLREGDTVRVKRGALRGVEGTLVRVKNRARLVVSVTLLARSVAVEIDVADIEPVLRSRPALEASPENQAAFA